MSPAPNDAETRTTDVGLFHYAVSYRTAADALEDIGLRATHPEAPREFLYFHAIELFIKAYLRNAGLSLKRIKDLGHDAERLRTAFEAHGGWLADEDKGVLDLMAEKGTAGNVVIRARYIATGVIRKPSMKALKRTAESLHETVHQKLKQSGRPVR